MSLLVAVRLSVCVLLSSVWLFSCAHISPDPATGVSLQNIDSAAVDSDDWTTQSYSDDPAKRNRSQLSDAEISLYQLPIWQLSGRISIRSEQDALSGALRWRQQKDAFVINFNSPLGQGAMQLSGDDIGVELRAANGRVLQADDLDQLFEEAAGWDVPLSSLRFWIFGIPSPDSKAKLQRVASPESKPARLTHEQSGPQNIDNQKMNQGQPLGQIIEIRQYDWIVEYRDYMTTGSRSLPRKLRLKNPKLKIKIVIDRWQINTEIDAQANANAGVADNINR